MNALGRWLARIRLMRRRRGAVERCDSLLNMFVASRTCVPAGFRRLFTFSRREREGELSADDAVHGSSAARPTGFLWSPVASRRIRAARSQERRQTRPLPAAASAALRPVRP